MDFEYNYSVADPTDMGYSDPFDTSNIATESLSEDIGDYSDYYTAPMPEAEQPSMSDAVQAELDRQFAERMRQEIEPYRIKANDDIPPLIPILKRRESLLCSEGNISAVVGEAKSKKTFFCTAMVGSMLDITKKHLFDIEHNRCKILWVDTEQSPAHIQKVLFRINVLGGLPHDTPDRTVCMLQLREKSPKDRYTALSYGIAIHQPKLVVVDGVSDLLNNTNNLEESEALVSDLLALASAANCHIMCVLHTNPNSDKARGHLGSTLMRKAETVIFVHKTGETSIVEPQYCRNLPFERFAFKIEEIEDAEFMDPACVGLGIPVECELPGSNNTKEDDCVRILREEFGGVADKRLLQSKLMDMLGVTQSYARVKIFRAIEKSFLRDDNGIVSIAD